MILNNSNWQPAIVRSVRGNSSYGFVNQIFEADVDKLKVEIALATKPNQINNQLQVLPCTLTVSYLENIDDDVFSIPLGLTKPLATLVEGLKPYSFRLKLDNPNATAVTGTVKKPKIKRIVSPINMPSNNPSIPQTVIIDPASVANIGNTVVAGIAANNQALADATASAIDRSDDVNQSTSVYCKCLPWSGDINQHMIVDENLRRLEVTLHHSGNPSTEMVSLAIGNDTSNKSDVLFDDYLTYANGIGGTWISTEPQAVQRIYAWVPAGSPDIVLLQCSESIHN